MLEEGSKKGGDFNGQKNLDARENNQEAQGSGDSSQSITQGGRGCQEDRGDVANLSSKVKPQGNRS